MKNPEKLLTVLSIAAAVVGARRVFPKKITEPEFTVSPTSVVVILAEDKIVEPEFDKEGAVAAVVLAADAATNVATVSPASVVPSDKEFWATAVVPDEEEFWDDLPDELPHLEPARPKVLGIFGLAGKRFKSVLPPTPEEAARRKLNEEALKHLEELGELDTCENAESAAWKPSWENVAAQGACRAKDPVLIPRSVGTEGPVESLEACARKCAESREDATPSCCEFTKEGGCNFLSGDGVFFQRAGGATTVAACFYRYRSWAVVTLLKGPRPNFTFDGPAE